MDKNIQIKTFNYCKVKLSLLKIAFTKVVKVSLVIDV